MELKEKVENLEKEINRKEKIIQISSNDDSWYFLTDKGRIIKKYYTGHPEIAGDTKLHYADITPDLEKI